MEHNPKAFAKAGYTIFLPGSNNQEKKSPFKPIYLYPTKY